MVIVIYALLMACVATLGRMDIPQEKPRKPRSFQTSNTPNRVLKYLHRFHSRNKEFYEQPTSGFQVTLDENDFFVTDNFLKEHWNIRTTYQPLKRDYIQSKKSLQDNKKTILEKPDSFILSVSTTNQIQANNCSTTKPCKKKKSNRPTCGAHPRTPRSCVTIPPKCKTTKKICTTHRCRQKPSDHCGHKWNKFFKRHTTCCICTTTQKVTTVCSSTTTTTTKPQCKTTCCCKTKKCKCRPTKGCGCKSKGGCNSGTNATVTTSTPKAISVMN